MIPRTVACQTALSVGFSRQEYWSELPFSFPGDIPGPGVKPMSPVLAGGFFITEPPGRPLSKDKYVLKKKNKATIKAQ